MKLWSLPIAVVLITAPFSRAVQRRGAMFCEEQDGLIYTDNWYNMAPCYKASGVGATCDLHTYRYVHEASTNYDNYWDDFNHVYTYLIQCDPPERAGLCWKDTYGNWYRWRSCPEGEEAITTIVQQDDGRRRNLRALKNFNKDEKDRRCEDREPHKIKVKIGGEDFVVLDSEDVVGGEEPPMN